jgi:hypothetical protein
MAAIVALCAVIVPYRRDHRASPVLVARSSSAPKAASSDESNDGLSAADTADPTGTPILGVLGVSGKYFSAERNAGIQAVTLNAAWSSAEPLPHRFSARYGQALRRRIAAATAAGFKVVLDPGLQYAPAWVFALGGPTRFVDQYGDAFSGAPGSGNDVANGVTDQAVRAAESSYLRYLGSLIPKGTLYAVRAGGGPLGELRYPGANFDGHADCYWSFLTVGRAAAATGTWTPGTGTPEQAAAFLAGYNAALVAYGDWLDQVTYEDFDTSVLLLLPGWGERPGVAAQEANSLLTLPYDEFNQGLDWTALLSTLPEPTHTIAYTTFLDAPPDLADPSNVDPATFIASLAAIDHLRLGGENTGHGTLSDLDLSLQRAVALKFTLVQWMNEAQLVASSGPAHAPGPTFAELKAERAVAGP